MTAIPAPFWPAIAPVTPLDLSRGVLQLTGTQMTVTGQQRVPAGVPVIIVSNHRSPLDAPVLMSALNRTITFACHPYMAHVPVLRDVIHQFGAFPLDSPQRFFQQGAHCLRQRRAVGVFPEGAQPMVRLQSPRQINAFHRGFAHLALRTAVRPLALLPVALVSDEQGIESLLPLKVLGWFDPNEPLFQKGGGHPIVLYRQVEVRLGEPIWITPGDREQYAGHLRKQQAQALTDRCWNAVHRLLRH